MKDHPIEGLMLATMNSINDMVDVNTIIGDPIEISNNIVIIPVSKVCFGFASGGSEFNEETVDEYTKKEKEEQVQYKLPFGGGAGAGVNINPVVFIVVQDGNVKLLPVDHLSALDRVLDYVPDLFNKINQLINKGIEKKDSDKEKIKNEEEKSKESSSKEKDYTYEFEYQEKEDDD